MRWWWDRHGQRGAAATEFVVIFPLFMILVLGTFSLGAAWFRQLNLDQAAREAARWGATAPTGHPDDTDTSGEPTDAWLVAVADKATAAASGQWRQACVVYAGVVALENESTTGIWRLDRDADGDSITTGPVGSVDLCSDDGDMQLLERRVQVKLETTSFFNAFAFATNIDLGGSATARFEAVYPELDNP